MNFKHILIGISIVALSCLVSYFWGYKQGSTPIVLPKADTLTTYIQKMQCKPKEVARLEVGKITVPYVVVGEKEDTIYVPLVREQKEYHEDSLYTAWVSGVEPQLDSIRVWERQRAIERYVSVPEQRKHHNVFVRTQLAMSDKLMLPITANYGYDFGFGMVYGGCGYDAIVRKPIVQVGVDLNFRW